MKFDKFIPAIVFVVLLAYLLPELGSDGSPIPLDSIGTMGVSLIFFFYGLKLSPEKIKVGLKNWKLHILVQSSTFVLFPILIIIFYPFIKTENNQTIWLSFLFLSALPSTVSSSVVMVSLAKGNVPAAIFNASISGLIGIIITPLWMGLFLQNQSIDFDLSSVYLKLLIEILIPVVLGLFLQKWWGKYAIRYNAYLTLFDKTIILLIIFKSFAESFKQNIFQSVNILNLISILIFVLILFWLVYFITGYLSNRLHFNREDKITAQYCGTKKSLVHGTVFSKILFPETVSLGIILLPLMVFHAMQIFIISIIATRRAKEMNH